MALKEKLRDLSKGLEGKSPEKIVADWNNQIEQLYKLLESFVQEYMEEGLVSVAYSHVQIAEDAVPPYVVPQMNIKSGKEWIYIVPVGRFVAGADGRVDMRNAENPPSRVLLLNVRLDNDTFQWIILFPHQNPSERLRDENRRFAVPAIQELETGRPISKESFEIAMEYLLV